MNGGPTGQALTQTGEAEQVGLKWQHDKILDLLPKYRTIGAA
jgi:hypothetical protein